MRRPRTPACRRFCVALSEIGVDFKDLDTSTTTLEDIFVDLVGRAA